MQLVRLLYFSRNRLAQFDGPIEARLAELVAAATAHNLRDGVTGVLVHDDKWFAQALEGEQDSISRTFERILRDSRHCDVTLITMRPVGVRRFGSAPVQSIAWSEDKAEIFRHYGEGPRLQPQLIAADRLADLLEVLLQHANQPSSRAPSLAPHPTRGAQWQTGNATNAA